MIVKSDGWHLEKKIPISIFVMIAIQFIGFIVVGTQLRAQVDFNRAGLAEHRGIPAHGSVQIILTRIETRQEAILKGLRDQREWTQRLRDQLEQRIERLERLTPLKSGALPGPK